MELWICAGVSISLVVIYKIWYRASMGKCTSKRRLKGLTALITGANTGIGLETARDLARRGARVLIACRDPQRGQRALEEVRAAAAEGATVELLSLDLASLASVRACAAKVLASEPRLDILINNAGAGGLGNGLSRDGIHLGIQVNHFGPFLLTLLLVDLLKKSAPSRVVFVSSLMHHFTSLKPHWLEHDFAKNVGDRQIYCMTKLANVIVANELARRLHGSAVTANSLHPGLVRTEFFRRLPIYMAATINAIAGIFCKNAVEGAQTTIHLAVSEEVEDVTGRYFSDCKEAWLRRQAYDEKLAHAVWKKSEELVGLRDDERPSFDS